MLKFLIFLGLFISALGGKSPHGEEYFAKLTRDQIREIPQDVIEDSLLDVPGLISKYGYPVETHEVQTEDGYLVTAFRIPAGRDGKTAENRLPVFLMHGLGGSAADWVYNGPGKSLVYILADAGYDVWMGNARGNYYSRKHVSLDPEGRKFWMFSWNEIGFYDVPAMIDHALKTNGNDKLHYIGHSQGTTSFFVMASSRPEYNDKILSMQAFAPVAYMANLKSSLVTNLAKYADTLQIILTLIGQNEFLPKMSFVRELAFEHCHEEADRFELCLNLFFGGGSDQLNNTLIPLYMSHYPAGASSRQYVHYAQEHVSEKFRNYDFGSFGNIGKYERLSPPSYKLRRVTAPVALHYSDNDVLADPIDVFRLHEEIPNSLGLFRVPLATFSHLDFAIAVDAKALVYDKTMEIMKSFE